MNILIRRHIFDRKFGKFCTKIAVLPDFSVFSVAFLGFRVQKICRTKKIYSLSKYKNYQEQKKSGYNS